MNTNDTPKTDTQFNEAPASWNTKYITPEGFECQLTLRGDTGQELLEKAQAAVSLLQKHGCAPFVNTRFTPRQPAGDSTGSAAGGNGAKANGENGNGWCAIHQCEMKRWEKNGRVWFSHRFGDGWCNGKAKTAKTE